MRKATVLLFAIAMSLVLIVPAGAGTKTKSTMLDFEQHEPIRGFSTVQRNSDGVDVMLQARDLTPGYAYSVWAVVFGDATNCTDGECGPDDVGGRTGDPSLFWAGIGGVANPAGNLSGKSTIGLEEEGAPGFFAFGPGLVDTATDEIHLIVRDHGPALTGDQLEAQTTTPTTCPTYVGGCPDVQASVHK